MRAQYMAADGEGRRGFRGEVGGEKRRSVDESEARRDVEWLWGDRKGKEQSLCCLMTFLISLLNLSSKTTARSRCAHRRFALFVTFKGQNQKQNSPPTLRKADTKLFYAPLWIGICNRNVDSHSFNRQLLVFWRDALIPYQPSTPILGANQ